jgi:DNA-binding transcriptional regulator LsrR (DeoR family)
MDQMLDDLGLKPDAHVRFPKLLEKLRNKLQTEQCDEFADKVLPLPSGPDGGDVIAADQILCNTCHAIIFFHDPLSPHPHNDDIRLLERTSRLHGVFSECVSDSKSAEHWIKGLQMEAAGTIQFPSTAQLLREKYDLKEVILAEVDDNKDSDPLGIALARACAGFLNQYMQVAGEENKDIHIGVAWGWGMRRVLTELGKMHTETLLKKPDILPHKLLWSPIIGIITAEVTDWEASMIAEGFRKFYGGQCEQFGCAGFAPKGTAAPQNVAQLINKLQSANLVLTSASAWNKEASLANNTGLDRAKLPRFKPAIAMISGIFLDEKGEEINGEYSVVGLGRAELQKIRKSGDVVLMCGGNDRNPVVLSALRAKLVSVLITTRQTAEWVLSKEKPK